MKTFKTSEEKAQIDTAWKEADTFARQVLTLGLSDLLNIFCIGSLPGNYFRPGQSDLDVVVLLSGSPPQTPEAQARHKTINATLMKLASQSSPYELEALLHYISEIKRDPLTGLLPNPDLSARLYLQSSPLYGDFDYFQLILPTSQDFQQEMEHYLAYWQEKWGDEFYQKASARELVNHALTLMRLYLASCRSNVIYNKTLLVKSYLKSKSEILLPTEVEASITRQISGKTLDPREVNNLRIQLPGFQSLIVQAIQDFKHG